MLLQKLGRSIRRRFVAGDLSRLGNRGTRTPRRLPRQWHSEQAGPSPPPPPPAPSAPPAPAPQQQQQQQQQQQLIVTQRELEAVVERAVERIAKDVARNTARIKAQGELVRANTESRRLWNEAAMEQKIEKVHDVLVREEARLQQWVDLGITGIKSQNWNRYSIGIAAGIATLVVVFKRQIYDTIGKEAAELTGAAISDPKLLERVQQLIVAIGKSPETVHALTDLLKTVFAEHAVLESLVNLTSQLLDNDATQQRLRTLIVESVFGDLAVRHAAGTFVAGALGEKDAKAALQVLVDELLQAERTHYSLAVAAKSTLGRALWVNREPGCTASTHDEGMEVTDLETNSSPNTGSESTSGSAAANSMAKAAG